MKGTISMSEIQQVDRSRHYASRNPKRTILILVVMMLASTSVSANPDFELQGQPMLGGEDAPIQIVEFVDYLCPHCKDFQERILTQLELEYINSGLVSFIMVNFPLPMGAQSLSAALAGECVYHQSETSFWPFHDAILKNQQLLYNEPDISTFMTDLAREYAPGLDYDDLYACIEQERYSDEVEADRQLGVELGVKGVPSVFVNGEMQDWSSPAFWETIGKVLAELDNSACDFVERFGIKTRPTELKLEDLAWIQSLNGFGPSDSANLRMKINSLDRPIRTIDELASVPNMGESKILTITIFFALEGVSACDPA